MIFGKFRHIYDHFSINFPFTAVQRGRQTVSPKYSPFNSTHNNKITQQQTQQQNEASTNIISEFLSTTSTISLSPLQNNFTIDAESNFGTKGISYLHNIIQWAKSNSYFPALAVDDQAALLKLSWKDLFVLNLSEPINRTSLPIQLMDIVRDDSMVNDSTFINYVKSFRRHLDTLSSLQLDQAELACLKALLLFTPGN